MKRDFNWTLVPFAVGGLVFSALACFREGWHGPGLVGMFLLLCLAGFAALGLLFLLLLCISGLPVKQSEPQRNYLPFYHQLVAYGMGVCCAFFRVRLYVSGLEQLPEGCWLLVGNHRSSFDPLVTGWALRKYRLSFVMKPSLARLPMVGPVTHAANFLSIDRENDRAALKTILEAAALIRDGIVSVGIYPEGTRSKGEGLLPFRNGAFKIAQKADAPIVVAELRGTDQIVRHFPWKRTDAYLEIRRVLGRDELAGKSTTEVGEEVRKCFTTFVNT